MRAGLFVIGVITLVGCSAQLSKPNCDDVSTCTSSIISQPVMHAVESGVIYSIPEQSFKFTLKRTVVTKASLTKAVTAAKTALDAMSAKVKARKGEIADKEKLVAAAAEGEAKAKLSLELEIAKLYLALESSKEKTAKAAHEKAKRELAAFKKDHIKDSIKLVALPVVPSHQKFVARLHRSEMSSENVELKTTAEGLLSSSTGKLEGQTDEIFVALASAFQSVSAYRAFQPQGVFLSHAERTSALIPLTEAPRTLCKNEAAVFEYTFNPNDADEYTASVTATGGRRLVHLSNKLEASGICYAVELPASRVIGGAAPIHTRPKTEAVAAKINLATCGATKCPKTYDGLLYPRTTNWSFSLYDTRFASRDIKQDTLAANLVDSSTLGVVPLSRSLFANNDFEFEFKDGLLTRYKSVTPSEAVAFLGMFPTAAKALVSIPAEIIKLRVDYSSSEEAYYQAQEAAILARQSLAATQAGQDVEAETTE